MKNLIAELTAMPTEGEWFEFKENNKDPNEIGEYISALSNSAALLGRSHGYVLWGISNLDHSVIGTEFRPRQQKQGNEELINWIARLLNPRINFSFHEVQYEGNHIVILEIDAANSQPIRFSGEEFIRIGSTKRKLKDFPEKEKVLWGTFSQNNFEDQFIVEGLDDGNVLQTLDYPAYFDLSDLPLPPGSTGILDRLELDGLINRASDGRWRIPYFALVLLAKDMSQFQRLERKRIRVVKYRKNNRINTIREFQGIKGYAAGFEGLIGFVMGLLPTNEVITSGIRHEDEDFAEIVVRELIANALIHQDFQIGGAGPMIEVFSDRIEITNPGVPLVPAHRFVDTAPLSRNEKIASRMRRFGICEERGSGWDKIAMQIELTQVPAPIVEVSNRQTRVTIFGPRSLKQMSKQERIQATYLHACLQFVNRSYLTNTSVRQRFGIETQNSAKASRMINEALEATMIVADDPNASPKMMRYVPSWVKEE